MDIRSAIIVGFLAGVLGTGLGGLLTIFIKSDSRQMSSILGFSGGIMLAAVFMELIPEAIQVGDLTNTMVGIMAGICLLFALDLIINAIMPNNSMDRRNYARTAILLFLAIAAHNFPEGMAIGSGYEASPRIGFLLMLTIAIHDIPEGMAVATSYRLSGMSKIKAFLVSLIAGTPTILGTVTGSLLGQISPQWIALSMGFAAGAMIYTVSHEILPQASAHERSSAWGVVWGFVVSPILFNLF